MSDIEIVKLCSVEGCGRKHYAKGLCQFHYRAKWQRENSEKHAVSTKKWNDANKEKMSEVWKQRHEKNRAKIVKAQRQRRAAQKIARKK